jgi:hypothetical protein
MEGSMDKASQSSLEINPITGTSSGITPQKKRNWIIIGALILVVALAVCGLLVAGFRLVTSVSPGVIAAAIFPTATRPVTATPAVAATPLPNPLLHPGTVIYSKSFGASGVWPWFVGHIDDSYLILDRSVTNGKYTWNATAKKEVFFVGYPSTNKSILTDRYQYSVDARMVGSPAGAAYGLVFNRVDKDNYWTWIIHANGTSALGHLARGKWAKNPLKMVFPIDSGQTNTLTMLISPDVLYFFVNGAQVGSYKTAIPEVENFTTSKKFGLCIELKNAGDKATFEFDHIIISDPQASGN